MKLENAWHNLAVEDALKILDSSRNGLSEKEAQPRLVRYGLNRLREKGKTSPALLLLRQFASPMVYILLIAVIVEIVALHNPEDAGVILVIVVINAVIGFIQELRADRALEALKVLTTPQARVRRNNVEQNIPASQLVPGDIMILQAGDKVPADGRLVEASSLKVDESPLTGESVAIEKFVGQIEGPAIITDMGNMVHMGTSVVDGRGVAAVTATGMETQFGKIVAQVQETKPPPTLLQKNVAKLARYIAFLVLAIVILIVIIGWIKGYSFTDIFILGIAAVVSAIPEELIVMVTVALALGMRRMARRRAIIRKLQAVETMGAVTVICSDKTGTLTEGEMTVREIFVDSRTIEVTGAGYDPHGQFLIDGHPIDPQKDESLALAMKIAAQANNTSLKVLDGRYKVLGDPTEGALLVASLKAGFDHDSLKKESPRVAELPFQSEKRYMATLHPHKDESGITYVEGSLDVVLSMSKYFHENGRSYEMTEEKRRQVFSANERMASKALRVVALAYAGCPNFPEQLCMLNLDGQLTFVALVGIIDPPREEAKSAIAACKRAGVRVIMITGDQKTTAIAIGEQLGLLTGEALTGPELAKMSQAELEKRIDSVSIFARMEPLQKLKVVEALKSRGHIVSMTGDGINDAPALRSADIGVAMGIKGTDVAREASDMVLADDNFSSIVSAVEEGRVIFGNIRRSVFFLLSTSMGELMTWASVILLGLPLPVMAVQILWINLVTDGACVTPLGVEPKHSDVMDKPPQNPKSGIIYSGMLYRMMFLGAIMAAGTVVLFSQQLKSLSLEQAQTMAFCSIVAFQWFNALNARSSHLSVFRIGPFSNRWLLIGLPVAFALQIMVIYVPALQALFHTVPLEGYQWGIAIGIASSVFIVEEIRKLVAPHLFERGR
jgi:Ca2+-transporting ATPase